MQRLSALANVDELLALVFELDCMILGRATTGLHDLVSTGGRTQLIVPINFSSLTARGQRTRYLKLCEAIPPAYRRFLLFEIYNIPPGTTGARILDLVVPLNPFAHGTLIEVSAHSAIAIADTAGSAILGVVTRADQFFESGAEAQSRLGRFVRQLQAKRLRVLLNGVNTAQLLRIAVGAGVDGMEGLSVADTTSELKSVYSWKVGGAVG